MLTLVKARKNSTSNLLNVKTLSYWCKTTTILNTLQQLFFKYFFSHGTLHSHIITLCFLVGNLMICLSNVLLYFGAANMKRRFFMPWLFIQMIAIILFYMVWVRWVRWVKWVRWVNWHFLACLYSSGLQGQYQWLPSGWRWVR